VCLLGAVPAAGAAPREEWFRGLDLEQAVHADLILVARVAEVGESKIVFGGKAERSLQQFKFEPVRTLKGVFARDQLLLTNEDLGYFDDRTRLERGQLRLLFLGRDGQGYQNYSNQKDKGSLDLALPPVKEEAEQDPLLRAVRVLITVTQEPDRGKRVTELINGLREVRGPAAVPLLAALDRRGILAAQAAQAEPAVTRHLADPSPAVREAAAASLRQLAASDYLDQKDLRKGVVAALAPALDRAGLSLSFRVTALQGLTAAGPAALDDAAAARQLKLDRPLDTVAEKAVLLQGAGTLRQAAQRDAVAAVLEQLPLDADGLQVPATVALVRLDADRALKLLVARLNKKYAAGLPVSPEIALLGEFPAELAVPALLDVFKLDLNHEEKASFAAACFRRPDPREVPALADMLSPRYPGLRHQAMPALFKIDTLDAARAVQPHLKEEADLYGKLQIAEFLGRHGMRDGYPYAMEHLSEGGAMTEVAVAALAAIREPKAPAVLRDILKNSNDLTWSAVAVRALGALKEKDLAPSFLEMADDFKRPLALPALLALADLGDVKALPRLKAALNSRKDEIVLTGIRAAVKLIPLSQEKEEGLRDQLAALVADGDASQEVRLAALNALAALKDPRLDKALAAAERDASLEGSGLLGRVEELLRLRKVKLAV
jgi:hypothetical protein